MKLYTTKSLAFLQLIAMVGMPFMVHAEELSTSVIPPTVLTESTAPDTQVLETEPEEDDADLDLGDDTAENDSKKDFTAVVRQSKDYYCGPASLATLLTQLGDDISESEVLALIASENLNSEKGTNLFALKQAASQLTSQKVFLKKWNSNEILSYISETSDPVLIHDEKKEVGGHFSVIREYNSVKGIVELSDTEAGNIKYSVKDFEHIYTGSALVVSDTNPQGFDISDEEAMTIWGKYVPVYIAAISVDGSDASTQNIVNAFKVCIASAMKITTLTTRNTARAACYTKLGNGLKTPLALTQEKTLDSIVDVTAKTDKDNQGAVGTVDILKSLNEIARNQSLYIQAISNLQALLTEGGGSLSSIATYKSQLDAINTKITAYNSDLSVLNSSLATKQASATDLNNKINSGSFIQNGVTYSLGAVGSQVTASSATVSKLSANLNAKLSSLDSQIANISKSISSANNNVATYTNQANSYTAQASAALNNYNTYKNKKGYTAISNNYYNSYISFTNQASTAKSNVTYWNNQINSYQSQINSLNNQKTDAKAEVSNASADFAKAQKLKAFGDTEIQRLKSLLATLTTDISSIKSQITAKTNVLSTYKTNNQITINTLTYKISKLKSAEIQDAVIKTAKMAIDTEKARFGFTTITYTNTSETQSLIDSEISLARAFDKISEDLAVSDFRTQLSQSKAETKAEFTSIGSIVTMAGATVILVGGSAAICFYSAGVGCPAAVTYSLGTLGAIGTVVSVNQIKIAYTGSNVFGVPATDKEWIDAYVMRYPNIALTALDLSLFKAATMAKFGSNADNLIKAASEGNSEVKAIVNNTLKEVSIVTQIPLKPLGLGSTATQKTWSIALKTNESYIEAKNVAEKLAMDEILSNPNLNSATIITSLNDSRWLGWSKLSYSRKVIDRGVEYLVEIHFNAKKINGTITLVDDFKFIVK